MSYKSAIQEEEKNVLDKRCDNNYNIGVTKKEVRQCHQQDGLKQTILNRLVSVSDWMLKRKNALKNTVKSTECQRAKLLGEGFICFWRKKNKKSAGGPRKVNQHSQHQLPKER